MRIRLRGPEGSTILEIAGTSTIEALRIAIAEKIGVQAFDLKKGYPPTAFNLDDFDSQLTLQDAGVKFDGEQFIVNPKPAESGSPSKSVSAPKSPDATQSSSPQTSQRKFASMGQLVNSTPGVPNPDDPPEVPMPSHSATMVLRIMPDDNSCLFRAFSSAALGSDLDSMHELRSLIASSILEQPSFYTEAVLEKPPQQYCRWIQTEEAWGGAIELDILARHFGLEVASINVQNGRVDQYNQGAERRCILVYSGIHYDVVALSPEDRLGLGRQGNPRDDVKVFDPDDAVVMTGAIELCELLKQRHYYTDTAGFSIKCITCGWTGNGEKAATEHASKTGHYNLTEVG